MNPSTTSTIPRPLALITGASSGIGYQLARQFGEHGFDLLITAEDDGIHAAAERLGKLGISVQPFQVDLTKPQSVEQLHRWTKMFTRPLDAVCINAGIGVGGAFAETPLEDELKLIALNITSTVHLAKLVIQDMVARKRGRVLFTSSLASELRSPFEAVYGASKSFIQSFSHSIRNELKDTGVVVTALLPGPTETSFFRRARMVDTKVGADKMDSAELVARQGFSALMSGRPQVQAGGLKTRLLGYASRVLPEVVKMKLHRRLSEPDSARRSWRRRLAVRREARHTP